MNMSNQLHGVWAFPDKDYEVFPDISPNGRIVQFIRQSTTSTKLIPMKLWYSAEGRDQFRIRSKPGVEGYTITMCREGDLLILENKKKTICRKISETDVPAWFRDELRKAHDVMAQLEKSA